MIHLLIPVVLGLLANATVAAVIAVSYLAMTTLRDWFLRYRRYLANKRYKAISLKATKDIKEALDNNQVTHVTGFFDTNTEELVEVQAWDARQVDPQVKEAHENSRIVVWS